MTTMTRIRLSVTRGETLAARFGKGPLTQRKAVDHALQIAHGLSAAHMKRITHRDIENRVLRSVSGSAVCLRQTARIASYAGLDWLFKHARAHLRWQFSGAVEVIRMYSAPRNQGGCTCRRSGA